MSMLRPAAYTMRSGIGVLMHALVSSVHVALHDSVPPLKPSEMHVSPPKLPPSHSSPVSSEPLPHPAPVPLSVPPGGGFGQPARATMNSADTPPVTINVRISVSLEFSIRWRVCSAVSRRLLRHRARRRAS